jgi:hypothetical protein
MTESARPRGFGDACLIAEIRFDNAATAAAFRLKRL